MPDQRLAWLDGRILPWENVRLPLLSKTLHYGIGVFEGIRAYTSGSGSQLYVFRLEDHMQRFVDSAKAYGFNVRLSRQQFCGATLELLRANNLREPCYIRPLAFDDTGTLDLNIIKAKIRVLIFAIPFKLYEEMKGLKVCVSSYRRISEAVLPTGAKACGHYTNSILAKLEADKNGFDDAILLDENGNVCEGSGANIFIVKNGAVITPPPSESVLEGITRETVIRLVRDLGYEFNERRIGRSELYRCSEAFFTGTAAEVTSILSIDHRSVGNGEPGRITKKLRETYRRVVKGDLKKYSRWLTPVYPKR